MSNAIIGQVLGGKYRIERVLGQGGMGVVVEAVHLQLHQRVAIKFILPEALHNPEIRGRFTREAMAAAKLRSPHVARVIDIGTLDTGSPFIVMEYLEGEDLGNILRRQGPIPITIAAAWVLEACEALAEAHSLGIVHRDLKPGNLFLASGAGGNRSIKVFDFGISKVTLGNDVNLSLTRTMAVMGSPGYASPEQLRSTKSVDLRTDIWAIGVTLYQLVSGVMPWDADTLPELSIKIAVDPVPPLSPVLRIPPAFERIIRRCLEKDPNLRFQNVAALAEELGEFVAEGHAAVERVKHAGMSTSAVMAAQSTTASSVGEMNARTHHGQKSALGYGIAAAAIVALGVVTVLVASNHGGAKEGGNGPVTGRGSPDAPPAKVVVAAPPDAPPPPKVVVVAGTPDAGAAVVPETNNNTTTRVDTPRIEPRVTDDHFRDFLAEARRLSHGSCAQAVHIYEKAIDMNPRSADALAGLGTCLVETGDYDRAVSNFLAALAISRNNPEALIGMAEAYQRKGNVSGAISYYKQYLEVAPRGDRAARARENLAKLGSGGGKQSDDDLFGAGGGTAR